MKTIITYEGKTFIEQDNTNIQLTNFDCACGNKLYVPLAVLVLGIVNDCAHCGKDYPPFPSDNHCQALVDSYLGLIDGEELVSLD